MKKPNRLNFLSPLCLIPGLWTIKLFAAVIPSFYPSLIFVGKSRSLSLEWSPGRGLHSGKIYKSFVVRAPGFDLIIHFWCKFAHGFL